jgi:hypothetical protein
MKNLPPVNSATIKIFVSIFAMFLTKQWRLTFKVYDVPARQPGGPECG